MSKSRIKKSVALEFIKRVKQKAIRSVGERHGKIIDAYTKEYFVKSGDYDRWENLTHTLANVAQRMANYINEMKHNARLVGAKAHSNIVDYEINNYNSTLRHLLKYNQDTQRYEVNLEAIDKLNKLLQVAGQEMSNLKGARGDETKAVTGEYNVLYNFCDGMRSGKAIVEHLNNLGFDTKSIIEETNKEVVTPEFDKDKLFVCGERS